MSEWLLDPEVAYLNHGAFGALARPVAEAAAALRERMERNPAKLLMRELPRSIDDVRARVAALLRADDAGCVFLANATSGTATVLASLAPSFTPGDELVTTDHRYGAVQSQLGRLEAAVGTTTVIAHVPLDLASVDDVVAAVIAPFTARTKLLVIDAIASLTGFVFPLREIVAAAHDRGVPVLVDAAHAPGQINVDLATIGADFWVGNLHKWICSPRAVAILHVAPRWRDTVRPLVASHGFPEGIRPAFDWTGTFDPVPLLAIPAALDFWEAIGWERVRAQQRALVDDGARRVGDALGARVPVTDDFRAAMRIIALPHELSAERARAIEASLATDHKVEVSLMTLQGATFVRVCGQVYTSPADYDRLAAALPSLL